MSHEDTDWLNCVHPLHARLSVAVASLLENILRKKEIPYLGVTARAKTVDGALEKIKRKEYSNPKDQITDLSGIRVVTYLERQALEISAIVKDLFEIDEANSHDRSADLGEDRMGYRSTHFVCILGKARGNLPEYDGLGHLKFEIQIRTVLQHAWAELAHDHSFKFGSALPTAIQRKLNLYSGMLEVVDGSFDAIVSEIENYKLALSRKDAKQVSETEINSISIAKFIFELAAKLDVEIKDNTDAKVLDELKKFGLNTIGDLETLITDRFLADYRGYSGDTSIGVLRHLLMYSDIDKYFGIGKRFSALGATAIKFLQKKYPPDKIQQWLDRLGILVGKVR